MALQKDTHLALQKVRCLEYMMVNNSADPKVHYLAQPMAEHWDCQLVDNLVHQMENCLVAKWAQR
jgi:hypothetical protein